MKNLQYLLILLLFFLSGCTKPYQARLVSASDYYKKVTKKKNSRPTLGIALSGGGSKAAPFAMGVLKRFVDEGWIDNVDIISSVSGGSYSAYYFYSKAIYMDEHKDKKLKNFFESCELDKNIANARTYKEYHEKLKECYSNENYGKYQRYVKEWQDLLSNWKSEEARGETHWDEVKSIGIAGEAMVTSIASASLHHLSNTVFDWKAEFSPSQYKYRDGIIRAFGKVPNSKVDSNESFENLKRITKGGKVPLWVINSSNFKKFWWKDAFREDDVNLSKSIFEITPYGFGSGEFGYSKESPDKLGLDLSRATLASGAFFDALGDKKSQAILFGFLHATNLRWGIKIPNYAVSKENQRRHNLLPFPLYYTDMNNSKITLADGGQSGDNLGVYSLIKRGVKNIVIVSGSQDYKTKFFIKRTEKIMLSDMCSVSNFLKKKKMTVWFNGRPNDKDDNKSLNFYNVFCQKSKNNKKTENLYHKISYYNWKKPIWKGSIRDENNNSISNLFFIKAAIDKEDLNISANKVANDNRDNYDKDGYRNNKYHYPYSLSYFWSETEYGKSASGFPQTSTVTTTLNNSQNLYQAYMDLGFYLSGYLRDDTDFKIINSDKK